VTDLGEVSTEDLMAEVAERQVLGRCPTCRAKWPLYVGAWDRYGQTIRCRGCLKIPAECTCD